MNNFKVEWHDSGHEPQMKPNPAYPKGKPLDLSLGAAVTCTVDLPYPAKRIGHYIAECKICGLRVACTTAGRPDDPISMKLACKTVSA